MSEGDGVDTTTTTLQLKLTLNESDSHLVEFPVLVIDEVEIIHLLFNKHILRFNY